MDHYMRARANFKISTPHNYMAHGTNPKSSSSATFAKPECCRVNVRDTVLLHHHPSSSPSFITTILHHHHPSSSPSFIITILHHHHPSSSPSFIITILHHHHPSSSPSFIITILHQHHRDVFTFSATITL
jgi:hypothetical protein